MKTDPANSISAVSGTPLAQSMTESDLARAKQPAVQKKRQAAISDTLETGDRAPEGSSGGHGANSNNTGSRPVSDDQHEPVQRLDLLG